MKDDVQNSSQTELFKVADINPFLAMEQAMLLEKAFDYVPRRAGVKRSHKVAENFVRLIQDMYTNRTTQIRTTCGMTDSIPNKVDYRVGKALYTKGSALSPLLLNLVMNFLASEIKDRMPWNILYEYLFLLFGESSHKNPKNTLRLQGHFIIPTEKHIMRRNENHIVKTALNIDEPTRTEEGQPPYSLTL
ncbi:uncharacterized protein LOC129606444 [Condylostylus longicornis]|uniref:uncharacterized protein LOC129606444 n=1 Tax=Condylostylus longicornis TaxID=2530218 RepID=UPI00244E270F|nr:uncharacterized protein LOC129606444 [Condylostylus longicornis]